MKIVFTSIFLIVAFLSKAQKTLQERLGYAIDAKLLILHADDLGMSHSENAATISAIENGSVRSASIMVPTPWLPEIAEYARKHPGVDFGLHLTLTSEWESLKWGPQATHPDVPGLVNKNGYFFSSVDSVYQSATASEVEKELRSQIEKAKTLGIDITHLDSHMGTLFGRSDYLRVYIKLGHEYKLPVLLSRTAFKMAYHIDVDSLINKNDVSLEMIYIAQPSDAANGLDKYYVNVLQAIQPGVSELIFHTAYNDSELKAATINHPDYGAEWRQHDFDFFTSEKCKKILKDQNIHVITWREIRDKLYK